jgi:hypothetical protein
VDTKPLGEIVGGHNICIGIGAGEYITTGSYNIGIGPYALADVTTESGIIEIAGVRIEDLKTAEELSPLLHKYIKSLLAELGQ